MSATTGFFAVEPIIPVVLHCLEARGIERSEALRHWGATPDQLAARRLPIARGYQLWDTAWALAGRDFALELARFMSIGDFGIYDYLWRNSPSLGQAIAIGGRFARLLGDDLDVTLRLDGDRALYCYPGWRPVGINEVGLIILATYARTVLGDDTSVLQVWMRECDASMKRQLECHFRCQIVTDAPCDALVFDRQLLGIPMPGADPRLLEVLLPVAERELQALPDAGRLVDVVRGLIHAHLAEGDLTAADVARRLDLGVATLRRQLRDHETSFSALRDQVRKDVALARLPDTTVSEVAALTGFSDHSAFCKAFRRWTGMSPGAFRGDHERDGLAQHDSLAGEHRAA